MGNNSFASEMAKVVTLREKLNDAYRKYFAKGGSLNKSSEGLITLNLGTIYELMGESTKDLRNDPVVTGVTVYSYELGPSRSHVFASLDDAIATVDYWLYLVENSDTDGYEYLSELNGRSDPNLYL